MQLLLAIIDLPYFALPLLRCDAVPRHPKSSISPMHDAHYHLLIYPSQPSVVIFFTFIETSYVQPKRFTIVMTRGETNRNRVTQKRLAEQDL
jgi:hypothetical protein